MMRAQSRNALAVAAAGVLLCAGCASSGAGTGAASGSGAGPRSPAQIKQQELMQMEKQGQRNDIDKPMQ